MKILSISEVQAKTTLCRAPIYQLMSQGEFPHQIRLKPTNRVVWSEEEIDDWLKSQIQSNNAGDSNGN
jgi:predicted DNA-binding transcriptional regulator AlpA